MTVSIDARRYDAVLFDLDGVVTDTAVVHAAAWRSMFDEFLAGRPDHPGEDHSPFTEADYRRFVDGKPRTAGVRDFLAARGITLPEDTVDGLATRKQRLFAAAVAEGVRPFESTIELATRLQAAGIGIAVYSASRNCRDVLRAANIDGLFDVCVDGADALARGLAGKPDPAVLLEAARQLDAAPSRCVVVEDALAGVTAGRRGGFGLVIGVDRDGSGQQLRHDGADVVVSDLVEVIAGGDFSEASTLPDAGACFNEITSALATRTPAVVLQSGLVPDDHPVLARLAARCLVVVGAPREGLDLTRLVHRLSDDGTSPLPVAIGTGPDAESPLKSIRYEGIGIKVGHHDAADAITAARFTLADAAHAERFLARLADHLDTAVGIPDHPWVVTFSGYDASEERLREALCTVGNGYLAVRGAAPEPSRKSDHAHHYPGTYCAGVFNRLTDDVDGKEIDNESMVNLPNWLHLTFRVDGGAWFDVDTAEVLTYRQVMDLRCAELAREMRVRDAQGRISRVTQRRIAAMHDPHVAALQFTLVPENYGGTVEFRTVTDTGVRNCGVARYHGLSDVHLTVVETGEQNREQHGATTLAVVQTVQSKLRIAVAARTTFWRGDDPVPVRCRPHTDGGVGHLMSVTVQPGQSVTAEKTAVVYTGRDPGISEPGLQAARRIEQIGRYQSLYEAHRAAWSRLWEQLDITVEGNIDEQRVLRLHLMHLVQTLSPHTAAVDVGVPARGLHGEAYRGHIFWDELFVFPVLNWRMPAITKALLGYRYRRLPAARAAAREAGHRGAMFPWQSGSDGREESQRMHLNPLSRRWNPDASARAHHIGVAVAYNVWQYYQTTADLDFLVEQGAEMIVDIARFWVSIAEFDPDRNRYVIRGVIGPDEFHSGYPERPFEGIDNNAYTNAMAAWVIARALDTLETLRLADRLALLEALGITDSELARFDDVSRRMFVPFHDGVISQFEGYEKLDELDWAGYLQRYGDISRLDRILESENDDANRYRVAKQADVLMLFYLLSADELRELFARLGYRLAAEQIPRTVDYYLRRTSHGSTLSAVVHSWVLARRHRDESMKFFSEVLSSDINDIQGGTTAEGIHLAAMSGSVDLLQRCFTGLEVRSNRLIVNPGWPESLGALSFPIRYRGHRLHIRVTGRATQISADSGPAEPVVVESNGRIQTLSAGGTISFG